MAVHERILAKVPAQTWKAPPSTGVGAEIGKIARWSSRLVIEKITGEVL